MVVILKSLVPGCLFNIVGFGSTFKSLFTTSQSYEEVREAPRLLPGGARGGKSGLAAENLVSFLSQVFIFS